MGGIRTGTSGTTIDLPPPTTAEGATGSEGGEGVTTHDDQPDGHDVPPDGPDVPPDDPPDTPPDLPPDVPDTTIVIYDNSDPDYTNPPFEDRLLVYHYVQDEGVVTLMADRADLNTAETMGGCRYLSLSPDGSRIAVVEQVGDVHVFDQELNLVAQIGETPTAVELTATAIYVLGHEGLGLYDYSGMLQESTQPLDHSFELAVDEAHDQLWATQHAVFRRIRLSDLATQQELPVDWFVVSIDVDWDGSIWAIERNHTKGGYLRHIGIDGEYLPTPITFMEEMPFSVRLDRESGDVWVAHSEGLLRWQPDDGTREDFSVGPTWGVAPDGTGNGAWYVQWILDGWGHVTKGSADPDMAVSGLGESQKWIEVLPSP